MSLSWQVDVQLGQPHSLHLIFSDNVSMSSTIFIFSKKLARTFWGFHDSGLIGNERIVFPMRNVGEKTLLTFVSIRFASISFVRKSLISKLRGLDDSSSSIWSREKHKAFENALATYPDDSVDRWEKIASDVPGKTLEEVKHHYDLLLDDVSRIESGSVPLPCYNSSSDSSTSHDGDEGAGKKSGNPGNLNGESNHGGKSTRTDQEHRKGIAWTEDEHRLFLLGLDKYGKGDWRSLSQNFVVTRTPTQVANHAQKYFIRLNSMNRDRRRSSIHDITSVNTGEVSVPQGLITGQTNYSAAGNSSSKQSKQQTPLSAAPPGVSIYGATSIGQPIGGPFVSTVGTPVNVPPPTHMAYGVRPPIPGAVVPGAPMTYPVPHTSMHR